MFSPVAPVQANGYGCGPYGQPTVLLNAASGGGGGGGVGRLTRGGQPRPGVAPGAAAPTEGPVQLRKLFIGGLSHETSDQVLANYYGQWGSVVDCIVIRDPHTKASRGFGFVTFAQTAQAEAAMRARPHVIGGKTVDPKRAIPREDMIQSAQSPPYWLGQADQRLRAHAAKLFVGGVQPDEHSVDCLRDYFSAFGAVDQVEIVGRPAGVAFVVFEQPAAVELALAQPDHCVNGRVCRLSKVVRRPPRRRRSRPRFRRPSKRTRRASRARSTRRRRHRARRNQGRRQKARRRTRPTRNESGQWRRCTTASLLRPIFHFRLKLPFYQLVALVFYAGYCGGIHVVLCTI